MSDIVAENIEWLWKPYIPSGKITIVQGDPGDSKTTMMLAIAAAVTNGEALPNHSGFTFPGNVIFQTAEDGLADTIKPKLEQFGADCDRVSVIDEGEQPLSLADERIEQAIIETDAKLLILDPLQAYLGGANMHGVGGVRPLMKSLGGIAERTGCAIVIIGHLNKKGGSGLPQSRFLTLREKGVTPKRVSFSDVFYPKTNKVRLLRRYRGLGSIDIYAAARNVLTVERVAEDENLRAVVQNKSNLAKPGISLAFELDSDNNFCWRGEYDIGIDELLGGKSQVKSESQLDIAIQFIEGILRNGAVPAAEILESAADNYISEKTLHRAKSALGIISFKQGDKWFWEIPIDVEYAVYDEDSQDGHSNDTTILTTLQEVV